MIERCFKGPNGQPNGGPSGETHVEEFSDRMQNLMVQSKSRISCGVKCFVLLSSTVLQCSLWNKGQVAPLGALSEGRCKDVSSCRQTLSVKSQKVFRKGLLSSTKWT